jgi:hypothetical protein
VNLTLKNEPFDFILSRSYFIIRLVPHDYVTWTVGLSYIDICAIVHSTYQELTLARQQLQDDYEKLKREEADKSAKLKELMLVSRSPRRLLEKAEKEVANRQTLLKDEGDFKDYIISPKRERLGLGARLEKACAAEEKPLSALAKRPACHLHPLQLHLLISVTMILLTHRYPQIVVLV